MGATLSSRAEWTSASDKGGKLDFSKSNETLLLEILEYVETLCREHPREASVAFKRPFVWKSSLLLNQFDVLKTSASDDYIFSTEGLVSDEKQDTGEPHLKITVVGDEIEIQALNFRQISKVLECSGEKKLKEVQLCLEANQDPIAVIMGPAFASSISGLPANNNTLLEIHERLAREKAMGYEGDSVDDLDSSFRLLLLLNNLDLKMLHSSVKEMGKEVRLSPEAVDNEMTLLYKFCGDDEKSCLKDLCYSTDMVFSNECRAPPWRQVLGDICYIEVTTCEEDHFFVTASTEGYYINKGRNKKDGEIDYDKIGDTFNTLVALLKTKSSIFATNIEKQEYIYSEERDNPSRTEEGFAEETFHDAMETFHSNNAEDQGTPRKAPRSQSSTNTASTSKKSVRPAEPSQKWKSLELSENSYHTALLTPGQKSGSRLNVGTSVSSERGKMKSSSSRKSSTKKSRVSSTNQSVLEGFESESGTDSSEDEEIQERRTDPINADLPGEYWQIQKLIKYLRGGNQTSTVIALCSILDFDLKQEACQQAIRDSGGMDLLINLLETDDVKCKIGTLRILRAISQNTQTRTAIVDLGGVPMLVDILGSPNRGLKCLAAETIANVAKFRRARRLVRQNGGIKRLVSLLENPGRPGSPITGEQSDLDVAQCAALGLWSCSKSRSNKIALLRTGAVPLLGKLLSSENIDVLIPVVGTLQECASERTYQELIQSEGMVEHLVRGLKTDEGAEEEKGDQKDKKAKDKKTEPKENSEEIIKKAELQKHCAFAIFKCAEEEMTRTLVREHGGLQPLTSLLKATDQKDLLCAVTGAVWKCSKSPENVIQFKSLKAIEQLVSLLNNQPEEVLINVVGALAECTASNAEVRVIIRKAGGVIPLVQLLTGTNQALLINTTKAVGACALDPDSMVIIDKQDGVRLLWSLLKSPNTEVQACAAWAICPCIQNAKDAGELVRSFVGGLELIVGLLKSHDPEVLAGVCAAIARIAKDEENLGVITDHGVVFLLAKLTHTTDDRLRKNLSDAIARCCMWRNNRVGFGEASAVAPLVSYLQSFSPEVHRSTACALHQLSKDPDNCITMHEAGVVQPLLRMVGSSDEVLQEAAAGCINNIRQLALANEKHKFK